MQINTNILLGKTQEHLAVSGEFAGIIHADVVEPFTDLVARAAKAGFDLKIISGYRSFERQLGIWNAKALGERPVFDDQDNQVDLERLSDLQKVQAIMRFSAMPGGSRHHWGTDLDVYDAAMVDEGYQIQLTLSETRGGGPFANLHRWLDEELAQTAFYRPYIQDAGGVIQDTGGVAMEPWHLSYKPLAAKYAQALNTNVLMESHQGVRIELADCIHENMDTLFDRFVKTN